MNHHCVLAAVLLTVFVRLSAADETPPMMSPTDFVSRVEIVNGEWKRAGDALEGVSPRYYGLEATRLDGHADDAHTYFVVHATNLWRYALAGNGDVL